MENKKLLEKLSQMRKFFVVDRVRDKQDMVYVEERGKESKSRQRKRKNKLAKLKKTRKSGTFRKNTPWGNKFWRYTL